MYISYLFVWEAKTGIIVVPQLIFPLSHGSRVQGPRRVVVSDVPCGHGEGKGEGGVGGDQAIAPRKAEEAVGRRWGQKARVK